MNVKKSILKLNLFVCLILANLPSHSQTKVINKYLVYLKDKPNWQTMIVNPKNWLSERAILRRNKQNISINWRDVPVDKNYIQQIQKTGSGVGIKNISKWFNALQIETDSLSMIELSKLSCIKGSIEPVSFNPKQFLFPGNKVKTRDARAAFYDPKKSLAPPIAEFGQSLLQMKMLGIDSMHAAGYNGLGIIIAVLDAGFYNANQHVTLAHLYQNKQILGTYDFVANDSSVYEDNYHGMAVLSCIAAYKPSLMVAGAYKSSYYLFRTEEAASEFPTECFNWIAAAEKSDSLGVDVIQSSLGYSRFSKAKYDFSVSQLNGHSIMISKAAGYCAAVGMVVVVSAGNEGNDMSWQRKLTAPADADSILTVGAIYNDSLPASFSSQGPTADGRIKPDVVAMGVDVVVASQSQNNQISTGSGTSYAAPMVCGLVAGLWSQHRELSAHQIVHYVRICAHKAAHPNNKIGYGIPSFQSFNRILKSNKSLDKYSIYPNMISNQDMFLSVPFAELGKTVKLTLYSLAEPKKLAVFNINQTQSRNPIKFEFAKLKAGNYVIVLENGQNQNRFPFVKQ